MLVVLHVLGVDAAEDEVPCEQSRVHILELPREHAPLPAHELQLRCHLTHVHEMVPEDAILLLENLMVYAIALLHNCALAFLFLVGCLESLTHLLVLQHFQVDVGSCALLNVCGCISVSEDFLSDLIEVFCDLVQIAHAEGHDPIEEPVHVSKGVALGEDPSDDLLVAPAVLVVHLFS